ncbi:hypothetical protein J2T08_000931 [Neorhizobium galegae]|nr:hypothetical protein [Neorhizobium galegae]MDQ0133030.1 hypothetical protein [Neorhizobium galegae]
MKGLATLFLVGRILRQECFEFNEKRREQLLGQ